MSTDSASARGPRSRRYAPGMPSFLPLLLLVVGCRGAKDRAGDPSDDARFSALFHADRVGVAEAVQVLVLPRGAVLADDPEAAIASGTTDTAFEVPEGAWTAEAAEYYEEDGRFDGQGFLIDNAGDYWIAPPLDFDAAPGGTLEHTFDLNFLVKGEWECCTAFPSGAAVCGLGGVDYHDGRVVDLPGLGLLDMDGMAFSGTEENGYEVVGAFVDATSGLGTSTDPEGGTHDVTCCAGSCG